MSNNNNIARYRALCLNEPSIPLFNQDWWLDATAGEDKWDVVLVESSGSIVAALPFVKRKKYGFTILAQPPISQTLGPWFNFSSIKNNAKLSKQREWMKALIDHFPEFDQYSQSWSWEVNNWLPFYWAGFEQTTNYTYILNDLTNEDNLWRGLNDNIRSDIKKAIQRYNIIVRDDLSFDDFLQLNDMTFQRQGIKQPYQHSFLKTIDLACLKRGVRKVFIAVDQDGRKHAGAYIVWDNNCAYYLMGGGDPELRNSGATSLCIWEAIKFSASVTKKFDFEGSMIESVERFFRAFGGVQTPFLRVSKTTSKLLKLLHLIRGLK